MATSREVKVAEWLKSEMIPKLLKGQKLISDIRDSDLDKFLIRKLSVQLIDSQEAFMLTNCYRVQITYEYKGAAEEIHLFVKNTPQISEDFFEALNFKALFNNEIEAYENIMPALEKFGNFTLNTAKFYYADLKSNGATVVTEDFGSHNWMITKERFNLSLDHAILAVKYLAQFHAVGFALRATNKSQFEELTQRLAEARYASDTMHPKLAVRMKCGTERTLRATRLYHTEVPESFLDKLDELLENGHQYSKELLKPQEPFVTLCHGDYLRNNVAYKYGEGGDANRPCDIIMFDMQTLRVSSPMLDLSTFLSLSTLAQVRHTYFTKIFQAYCEQMKQSYETFAHQPMPHYLSFESLLKEYITFLPYSLRICSSFLHELVEPLTISSEEMLNLDRSDKEIVDDILSRGGEVVDRELAHQLKELYELATSHNVDVFF